MHFDGLFKDFLETLPSDDEDVLRMERLFTKVQSIPYL